MASHGMSVVELVRGGKAGSWKRAEVRKTTLNRRLHVGSRFQLVGPAAGDERLRTAADDDRTPGPGHPQQLRRRADPVGHGALGRGELQPLLRRLRPARPALRRVVRPLRHQRRPGRGWNEVDPRFDLALSPTSRSASAGSSSSTRTTRTRRRASTRCSAASSTRAPTSPSPTTARSSSTWATTSGSTTSTASSPPAPTTPAPAPGGRVGATCGCSPPARSPSPASDGDGLEDERYDGSGIWIPLASDTESFVDGMTVADVLIDTRLAADQVCPDQDGPARGRRGQPGQRPRLLRADQQLQPRHRGGDRRGQPALPVADPPLAGRPAVTQSGNRNGYVLEMDAGQRQPRRPRLLLEPDAGLRRPAPPRRPTSRASRRSRSARSAAPTTWPSTPRATSGSPPTATCWAPTTACSGCRSGARSAARCSSSRTVPFGAECCGPFIHPGREVGLPRPAAPGRDRRRDLRDPVEHLAEPRGLPAAVGGGGLRALRPWRLAGCL